MQCIGLYSVVTVYIKKGADADTVLFCTLSYLRFHVLFIVGLWNARHKLRILGDCLLITSLPGKALRTLVYIMRLAEQFNMHFQSRAW